jgi:hypothetical protein
MEINQLETTTLEGNIANVLANEHLVKSADEKAYLESMMPNPRQESYTCITGCTSCVSCGGND